ncbi:hypothetical protein ACTMS0_11320 [Micromonospora sp. H33]|uniref:hypothetical protein n=1 Tax=Micromonospora sp. H33 TaxID=3452215 RepID=UPI003F8B8E7A
MPEVAAWETGRTDDTDGWPVPEHRDRDVSAPLSGAPTTGGTGREEADEWPTEAVTDRPTEAVEDRSADVPGDWPPTPPAGDDRR